MIPEHKNLNMGCGFNKLEDYWNVDVSSKCNPDEIWDFDTVPWPWEDNLFEKIQAANILEHLGQNPKLFTEIIKEMYRVSKNHAEWFILVPHYRCDLFWDDYTHVRALNPKTFKMFDQMVNYESIQKKCSDSTYGIYHDVDLEVLDSTYNLVGYWKNQLEDGMLGGKQLDINLNTLANVAESISIFVKVHKPGRYQSFTCI